jgi:hypothetical protein
MVGGSSTMTIRRLVAEDSDDLGATGSTIVSVDNPGDIRALRLEIYPLYPLSGQAMIACESRGTACRGSGNAA